MIYINGQNFTLDVYVASITDQLLLGFDFLRKNKAVIDLDEVCMRLGDVKIKATVRPSKVGNTFSISKVSLVKEVVLEPDSVKHVEVKIDNVSIPTGCEPVSGLNNVLVHILWLRVDLVFYLVLQIHVKSL